MSQSMNTSRLLADLPPYIYGTTRLGDDKIPFDERVRLARAAMDAHAVSAQQPEALAGLQFEVDAAQHVAVAVPGLEFADGEHRGHGATDQCSPR